MLSLVAAGFAKLHFDVCCRRLELKNCPLAHQLPVVGHAAGIELNRKFEFGSKICLEKLQTLLLDYFIGFRSSASNCQKSPLPSSPSTAELSLQFCYHAGL